jgi:hypothetical protein
MGCLRGMWIVGLFAGLELLASPFASSQDFAPQGKIGRLLLAGLTEAGLKPAPPCSDAVFCRRVHIDIAGRLPEPGETQSFLDSKAPDKRAKLVERLIGSEAFVDLWTLKWCDLLRVKAEFPINLWPNGVQAYARWIREAVANNMPYDQFARALLTSNGSNFRVPPVNFYRAVQGEEPDALAAAVALTFMGTRIETWPPDRRAQMEAIFSQVHFKSTAEWKEVIVLRDPAATEPISLTFPDGSHRKLPPEVDPRQAFADWLIREDNAWFARNVVNRAWSWFMGRGLIHEPDDIRVDNPAVHPRLLAHLEAEFVRSGYDLRQLFRSILTSAAYQQSSIPIEDSPKATAMFAHYPPRRLDAEVLADALSWLGGNNEQYSSAIPEPFTFIPNNMRTVQLVDGSITSQFLKMFGRPSRDTGLESERSCEISDRQRLHLINSTHIKDKIERSWRLNNALRAGKRKPPVLARQIYMNVLSRPPTEEELSLAKDHLKGMGDERQAAIDLAWALVNSKEFLYRH